ncbi:hypothetical protein BJ508DRAFT_334263 [Ascobolus immersus RN42]|uniref:Uncharacterized protein n=1 Tax=Ascobolus immersus RN42 TaxID=1160509 RepID=A0A3N4HIS1_ASCIM|nr:hypothetical protein BJ508DRAFT_334263 [Ascobolus immersus RN42]
MEYPRAACIILTKATCPANCTNYYARITSDECDECHHLAKHHYGNLPKSYEEQLHLHPETPSPSIHPHKKTVRKIAKLSQSHPVTLLFAPPESSFDHVSLIPAWPTNTPRKYNNWQESLEAQIGCRLFQCRTQNKIAILIDNAEASHHDSFLWRLIRERPNISFVVACAYHPAPYYISLDGPTGKVQPEDHQSTLFSITHIPALESFLQALKCHSFDPTPATISSYAPLLHRLVCSEDSGIDSIPAEQGNYLLHRILRPCERTGCIVLASQSLYTCPTPLHSPSHEAANSPLVYLGTPPSSSTASRAAAAALPIEDILFASLRHLRRAELLHRGGADAGVVCPRV